MVHRSFYSCLLLCLLNLASTRAQASLLSDIHVSAKFLSPDKLIDPEVRACALSNGLPVACSTLEVCVRHGRIIEPIVLNVKYELDSSSDVPRITFLQPEGSYVQEEAWPLDNTNTGACLQRVVFIRPDIKDKLSPIGATVKFSANPNTPNAFTKFSKDELKIKKNCGSDDVCVPELKLDVLPNVPTYIIGSFQLIELGISVTNVGEDSFGTYAETFYPEDVKFVNVRMITNPPVLCYLGEKSVICEVGNPLPANTTIQYVALFEPQLKDGFSKNLKFSVNVNTSTPEDDQSVSDSKKEVSINVEVSSKLKIEGESSPERVSYKQSKYPTDKDNVTYISELGPKVVQTYTLSNEGLNNITEIDLRIIVLNLTLNGNDLFYITKKPQVEGNVTCEYDSANPKDYKLEDKPDEKNETGNNSDDDKSNDDDDKKDNEKSRKRRQLALIPSNIAILEAGILSQCSPNQCVSIKCTVKELQPSKVAKISLQARLNAKTLKDADIQGDLFVASALLSQIKKVPYLGNPGHVEVENRQIITNINIDKGDNN